eukprot:13209587-Alexandrium_andersonii.AAC.1
MQHRFRRSEPELRGPKNSLNIGARSSRWCAFYPGCCSPCANAEATDESGASRGFEIVDLWSRRLHSAVL